MANKDFKGEIGFTVKDSKLPQTGQQQVQHENEPNVVYIVLDDVGFAHLGAYGSDISTPNIDRLAEGGLRYNNFHTTAICSPTRASLLTGQNPHTAGVSNITDFVNGYPNKQGYVSANTALLSEILQQQGYSTFAVGKWHLSPQKENTFVGPFDQWPLSRGFDHFYGFLNGETDQYTPDIILGNDRVPHPKTPEEGYHLTEDLVDKFIEYVGNQKSGFYRKPFFGYLALGAAHAPHQAPPEFIDKYKGKYDEGWDVAREKWFKRQKELGIIPQNTELPPLTDGVTPWNELSADQKRLYARAQEVFAGFLEHTDYHIGRAINYLEEIGELDNTIIVLISDNGASREGGYHGTWNEWKNFAQPELGRVSTKDDQAHFEQELARIDDLGTPRAYNHYPTGWALAGNTPLRWYKTYVYAGGVRDPLIIHYPKGIQAKGEIRTQFSFVSDITPTVLELLNIEQPKEVKNVEQIPFAGISLAYSFNEAEAPAKRTTQHFELWGHRAIYKDGWKALTRHIPGTDYDTEQWELFKLDEDFSEANDVSLQYPEKLQELTDSWLEQATKYDVFPIDDSFTLIDDTIGGGNTYYFYPSKNLRINTFDTRLNLNSYLVKFTAAITRQQGDEGVLIAQGSQFGGFSIYIQNDRLVFHYSKFGETHYTVISTQLVPTGEAELQVVFEPKEPLSGVVTLYIDGEQVGQGTLNDLTHLNGQGYLTVGENLFSAVSPAYEAPYTFTGKLHYVKVEEPNGGLSEEERLKLEIAAE